MPKSTGVKTGDNEIIEIIRGQKRSLSYDELLRLVELRKEQFLRLGDKMVFGDLGSVLLPALQKQELGDDESVFHTIRDDKPVIKKGRGYLDLSVQGFFEKFRFPTKILDREREYEWKGWGMTSKGKWVQITHVTKDMDIFEQRIRYYCKSLFVSIRIVGLKEIVRLVKTQKYSYRANISLSSVTCDIWSTLETWLQNYLENSEARIQEIRDVVQEFEDQTLILNKITS